MGCWTNGVPCGGTAGSTYQWKAPVKDKDLALPPVLPSLGDRYLIYPAGLPGGAWAGHKGEIAEWRGTAWEFSVPADGWAVVVEDEDEIYVQGATAAPWVWTKPGGPPSGPAGGDLSGTYPNPSVVNDSHDHNAATLKSAGSLAGRILTADGAGGSSWQPSAIVFPEFSSAASEGLSTTASPSFQTKLTLNPTLVGGTYKIEWFCELAQSSASSSTEMRILVDAANVALPRCTSSFFEGEGGVIVLTLAAGAHTISLVYRCVLVGIGTASIRRARLAITRVV